MPTQKDEIHVASGLASSLSANLRKGTLAIEALIDKLGTNADHHIWNNWPNVAAGIVKRHKAGLVRRVIVIGHSNGVIFTNSIAETLGKNGIKVDLLVALDPTAASFPVIGPNVLRTAEYWATSGWPAFVRHWGSASLKYTKGWSGRRDPVVTVPGGHVELSQNPKVWTAVVAKVKETLA